MSTKAKKRYKTGDIILHTPKPGEVIKQGAGPDGNIAIIARAALRALNTAPNFKVGDDSSYAIAYRLGLAIDKASSIW